MKVFIFKILIPIWIIALGIGVAFFLKSQEKEADYKKAEQRNLPVEIMVADVENLQMKIIASGSVEPAKQIQLIPEVSGRIDFVSPELIPGGMFKKGDIIARIDKKDYKLALAQQEGQVQQAELNLTLEKSRGDIAKKEWNMLGVQNEYGEDTSNLALRKPHLQEAKQRTTSAKSSMQRAKLNLKKTIIRAPFDAIVIDKKIDTGQLVGPSSPIATLMGADELWINVSVPIGQLNSILVPGLNSEVGSIAMVTQKIGNGNDLVKQGSVIRLHRQLDAQNRTATVIVEIKNPFVFDDDSIPLLAGAYVEVEIKGGIQNSVTRIPRSALRDNSFVWLVDKNNKLKKSSVTIAWKEKDTLVLSKGVNAGDKIVTSPVAFALEGMNTTILNGKDKESKDSAGSK